MIEEGAGDRPSAGGDPEDVLNAFKAVSEAISEDVKLEELLHLVAAKLCELIGIRRCSVYLKDGRTGLFRGKVAHTDRNVDAAIKGLTAGIEADGFTREILQTKQPVLIANAKSDPRPVHSTMLEWDVRTMLGVPMIRKGDVVGLLFLDNQCDPHTYSPEEQKLCATFANLSAIAIAQAQLTADLRESLGTVERQNSMLRAAVAIEDKLAGLVLEGADLSEIVEAVSELTAKPAMVVDSRLRTLAIGSAGKHEGGKVVRDLAKALRDAHELGVAFGETVGMRPELIDPRTLKARFKHRLLVSAVTVGKDAWGYLVVVEHGTWFSAHDRIVARRSSGVIALQMTAEQRAAKAQISAGDALVRDLLVGAETGKSLERRAAYHGVSLAEPRIVCALVPDSAGSRLTPRRIEATLDEVAGRKCSMATDLEQGMGVVIAVSGADRRQASTEARRLVARAIDSLDAAGTVSIGLSCLCRQAEDYPPAYREAQQLVETICQYSEDSQINLLAAEDLGPARLLLASTDRVDADRFAHDAVGELLVDPNLEDLLKTVQTFFDNSRSVRNSARALGVHENTVRYRLARIEEITDLQVASDADDQLTIQLALLILRLEGTIAGVS